MQTRIKAVAGAALCLFAIHAQATDRYWINGSNVGTIWYTNAANWDTGVPGATDNANFTNVIAGYYTLQVTAITNANVFFDRASGNLAASVASGVWLVTNSFVLSRDVGTTNTLDFAGGAFTVTNDAGTASLGAGAGGAGYFTVSAGTTLTVDRLFATNGYYRLYSGTLNILNGSKITSSDGLHGGVISPAWNGSTVWNLLGGTNEIDLGVWLGNNNGISGVITVGGPSTVWSNTGQVFVGAINNSVGNQFIVTNGAYAFSTDVSIGQNIGNSNDVGRVTGSNSRWQLNSLAVGYAGGSNRFEVLDGGQVTTPGWVYAGVISGSNTLLISGNGSSLSTGSGVQSGNGNGGGNLVLVTNSGVLETRQLLIGAGNSGTISNVGGIYQFTWATPVVTPGGVGSIAITDGTISYRGVSTADVYNAQVAKIAFQGNNTFMLNSASNIALSTYTFDDVAHTGTATNYQRLALVGNGSRWTSTTLNIGRGGDLLISNSAAATVAAALAVTGSVHVANSRATFTGPVSISGQFVSDPSTNTFLGDVTVASSGTMSGGAGDLFDFKKSFLVASNNRIGFDLSASLVSFSGGGAHTNLVTGSDLGNTGSMGYADGFTRNFSYGALALGSTNDNVYVGTGDGAASNALYVTSLLLPNHDTNWVSLLHTLTPDINIYYLASSYSAADAYLGDQVYTLDGGGFLMPAVPEPSTVLLFGVGACVILWRRGQRK